MLIIRYFKRIRCIIGSPIFNHTPQMRNPQLRSSWTRVAPYEMRGTSCMERHAGNVMHGTSCMERHAGNVMRGTSCMERHTGNIIQGTLFFIHKPNLYRVLLPPPKATKAPNKTNCCKSLVAVAFEVLAIDWYYQISLVFCVSSIDGTNLLYPLLVLVD